MGNRPYITDAQVRYSVLRRRAIKAQAEAQAKRSRRPKPAEPKQVQVPEPASQEA